MFRSTVIDGFSGQDRFVSGPRGGSFMRHFFLLNTRRRRWFSGLIGFCGDPFFFKLFSSDFGSKADEGPAWFRPDGPEIMTFPTKLFLMYLLFQIRANIARF